MKIIPALLFILYLVTQVGCVQTISFAQVEPQLKQWEKNREYGRSLDTLAHIDPRDPDYARAARLRNKVEKQAAEFEQEVVNQAQQNQQKGDWASALNQYDEALTKHSRSAIIKDGLVKLHQQQRDVLDRLGKNLLIQRGEWLLNVLPIYQDIVRVNPRSNPAKNRLDRILAEAVQISSELTRLGDKALANNDFETAEERLSLAVKLNNSPAAEEGLKKLRSLQKLTADRQAELVLEKQKQAREKQENIKRSLNNRVKRYQTAFAAQDFITADKQLLAIEKLDNQFPGLAAMRTKLNKAVADKVVRLFENGVRAYSRGEYEQAAKEWRAALILDANHQQAQENLQRAEKVLEKLEYLKQKQVD